MPFSRNKLFYKRWELVQFMSEGTHVFPPLEAHTLEDDRPARIKSLIDRFTQWSEHMPSDLQYSSQMPVPLYEFQYDTR